LRCAAVHAIAGSGNLEAGSSQSLIQRKARLAIFCTVGLTADEPGSRQQETP
jgi:hypothetical protein